MSVRYGIALIPEPGFTARVYRARQLICGQYACWAAEMHMLRLPLIEYFQCPEAAVESISAGLGRVAREGNDQGVPLAHHGASTAPECPGDIFLDFTVPDPEDRQQRRFLTLNALRTDVMELLRQVYGVNTGDVQSSDEYRPQISLMQHAELPPTVFESAVVFAGVVIKDLEIPNETRAWQLVLLRFESDAAGEDWNQGGWSADLRWNLLASYPMYA